MRKITITFGSLAIVAFMFVFAAVCQAQESPPLPPQMVQQAPQKAPVLADYQTALTELRGKAAALNEVKKGIEDAIASNLITMDRVNTKIQELTPKPEPAASKEAPKPEKSKK